MIKLNRTRTKTAIPAKYRGAQKLLKEAELLKAQLEVLRQTKEKIEFDSSYWKSAKAQLKKESHGKCAYCEATVDVVAHGDVEHYRPKSIYWWLAYTYDNYLYACQICNQIYKKDHFDHYGARMLSPVLDATMTEVELKQWVGKLSPDPVESQDSYSLQHYIEAHTQEQAALINPYFEDPSQFLAYKVDEIKREVLIIAKEPQYARYVQAIETYYGINRVELKAQRFEKYKVFKLLKKSYLALNGDPALQAEIKQQIEEMLADHYLFAGMNRYFNS